MSRRILLITMNLEAVILYDLKKIYNAISCANIVAFIICIIYS